MIGEIGLIVISFGVLYILYQAGRFLKYEAEFSLSFLIKKLNILNISEEDYDKYEKRFSTLRRFIFFKYIDENEKIIEDFEKNVDDINIKQELNRKIKKEITKEKNSKEVK